MAWGLPKLPGLTFADPTKTQHHIRSTLHYHQGHRFPDTRVRAPGGDPTDADSNAYTTIDDSVNYDPSLTYGRVKQPAMPAVIPHWVHYDKRCLTFTAFMKQPVYDNPEEAFRVRVVNIVYFLEDDTMTVMEPRIKNSGLWQGRMVKRGKIPKNDLGETWHWKDLDVGKDLCIYGKVFHTVSCDLFTKEWLESQGIEVSRAEDLPLDAHTQKERWKNMKPPRVERAHVDKLRRFLEYDGRVLTFDCLWDDRESENGELHQYKLLYFLQDDTVAVKELDDDKGGRDPFPLLLKKTKLPKKWKERPVSFPSIAMEMTEDEVTEYYSPKDLVVGETIFILGRRCLLFDCDKFTRHYYKTMLNIDQPQRIEVREEPPTSHVQKLPPHIGIGSPEDTLQSCFGLIPKPPYKDIIKYNLNASKYLRYLCELDWIHPEDQGRQFVLAYSLADGAIKVSEISRRNSGFREGTFLKSTKLPTPDSDPNFPTYFTPDKFYIGAKIPIFNHRFKITGCDLYVYRYMSANPDKFPPEVIDNVRNYHLSEGNLNDDIQTATQKYQEAVTRAELAKIGAAAQAEPSDMERCLAALDVADVDQVPGGAGEPALLDTPPATTDRISYDESLRITRASKPTCDNIQPLKGILKSGAARDDHQKVVCFNAPAPDDHRQKAPTIPDPPPQYNVDENFCKQYKDAGDAERKERREKNVCAYDVIPKEVTESSGNRHAGPPTKGHLESYNVDCKQVPEHMKLPPSVYETVKHLRQDIPDISPAAARGMAYFLDRTTEADCNVPRRKRSPCERDREDVTFGCPRVEPRLPCCQPGQRNK